MWTHLQLPTDLSWLSNALQHGTLLFVCDGSYQPDLTTKRGAASWILEDTLTHSRVVCTLGSTTECANAYRSELTGLYSGLAFLSAVCEFFNVSSGSIIMRCDCKSAIYRSSTTHCKVPTATKHSDILRVIRRLSNLLPINVSYRHIRGHQDDFFTYSSLSRELQLNIDCDLLAKSTLRRLHHSNFDQPDSFHHEDIVVRIRGVKPTGDVGPALRHAVSHLEMRHWLVHHKRRITATGFEQVNWIAIEQCLHQSPHLLHLWATKHISGFCATNSCMHQRDQSHSPLCPLCNSVRETTTHLLHCSAPERDSVWSDAIDDLRSFLDNSLTAPLLRDLILQYVIAKGQCTMSQLTTSPSLQSIATSQDSIGWDNFLEGKTSVMFQDYQHRHLRHIDSTRSSTTWSANLVKHLLLTVHKLWCHRNEVVHKRDSDGLLLKDASELRSKIKTTLQINPLDLLEEDRQLLRYSESLIQSWPSGKRKLWLTAVEAAQEISERQQQRSRTSSTTLSNTPSQSSSISTLHHSTSSNPHHQQLSTSHSSSSTTSTLKRQRSSHAQPSSSKRSRRHGRSSLPLKRRLSPNHPSNKASKRSCSRHTSFPSSHMPRK